MSQPTLKLVSFVQNRVELLVNPDKVESIEPAGACGAVITMASGKSIELLDYSVSDVARALTGAPLVPTPEELAGGDDL